VHQPNPWILCMGGFALFNVAAMVYGIKAPEWVRLLAAGAVLLMGVTCIVLAFKRQFGKKPVPPPKPMRKQPLSGEAPRPKPSSSANEPG
jgi:hypothetical protein